MTDDPGPTVPLRDPRQNRTIDVTRVIGRYGGERPGPLLVCVGGVHGNEPSGAVALRAVFDRLAEARPPAAGTFVGLAGNLPALRAGRRYVDEDLNRIWLDEVVARAHRPARERRAFGTSEEGELAGLVDAIRSAESSAPSGEAPQKVVLDLHTTSADSDPWLSVYDHPSNLAFAAGFPVHAVVGLERAIRGCMIEHLHGLGWVGFTVEAGRHDDVSSIDAQEACVWLALARAGVLAEADVPDFDRWRGSLAKDIAVEGRRTFRVVDRHRIRAGERFTMRPGYVNFQPIREGEVLGDSDGRPITSRHDGRILMPLYQAQGDDGFYVVQE